MNNIYSVTNDITIIILYYSTRPDPAQWGLLFKTPPGF